MNILITGSDGYIGVPLVNKLILAGHSISVSDKRYFLDATELFISSVKRLSDDILDIKPNDLDGIDHIIHLAAISNDPSANLNSKLTWETNVLGTMKLIDAAVRADVKHFTFASSGSVYGLKDEVKVTEDLELVPLTDYNKSKMCAERIVLSYSDSIGVSCIRPATVCGVSPRQRLDVVVNILTHQALLNNEIKLFGGDQIRPHIHINDMVNLYEEITKNPENYNGIFNAGFENLENSELAKLIADTTGASIKVTQSDDNRSYRLCSEKLLDRGFKPNYSVSEAVSDIAKSFYDGNLMQDETTSSVAWLKEIII